MPWILDAPEHAPHSQTKKNDRGSKVGSVSIAIKRDTLCATAHKTLTQPKHLQLPLSQSRQMDQLVWPRKHKPLSPPSMQNQKMSGIVSPMNYLERRRIFSTPEPSSLG